MHRGKQNSRKAAPPAGPVAAVDEGADIRVPVLCEMIDMLDLHCFFHDPEYRRRLNDVLGTFSDAEFDRFERIYTTRRFTLN